MESTALVTENLRNTMATVDAMKTANKEIKKQYGKIDIDKIEVTAAYLSSAYRRPLQLDRICTTTWKIFLNRPMKFKNRSGDPMQFQMR